MTTDVPAPESAVRGAPRGFRAGAARLLRAVMEVTVLALVALSPWALGSVHPFFESALYAGVAGLLALWGARMLLEWEFSWARCPVALCLAALLLLGMGQLVNLPDPLLSRLSPATALTYARLLPPEHEVLFDGEPEEAAALPAGHTLSLYPGATRRELIRLLAVFALFAVVRNNTASPGALRRLAVVALANACLLTFLALVQRYSSPPNLLYWTFPSQGQVFGPFICRNHFPFYVNMCAGLGLGLLLGTGSRDAGSPLGLLHSPAALWVSVALAFLLSGVVLSLSRGGVVALLVAGLVCLAVRLSASAPLRRLGAALLIPALALAALAWLGLGAAQARLGTLGGGEALEDGRVPLWSNIIPAVKAFPLWGTGYGTYQYVEPLYRDEAGRGEYVAEHAHNDYLESLVEGGVPRLALGVTAVALVMGLGCRAFRQQQGRRGGGLVLGALFGFTTAAVHSLVDFGLHVPAVAFLATVLAAHLCAAARGRAEPARPGAYALRLWGLAPCAGAALAVALALVLYQEGRRSDAAERCRLAALRLRKSADPAERARGVAELAEAVRLTPENARLQVDLAEALLDQFNEVRAEMAGKVAVVKPAEERDLARRRLLPALRHHLLARDLCPLLPEPEVRLAAHAAYLARADARSAYWGRAKLLRPFDARVWYLCGAQELAEGRYEGAWRDWRRCLELSDHYLGEVLRESARHLAPGEVLDEVLPDRPGLVLAAAAQLYPDPEAPQREPFARRALALLDARPGPPGGEEQHLRALACWSLGRGADAAAAYEAALAVEPAQLTWRCEFAELLRREDRRPEARRELEFVLAQQPGHPRARELLTGLGR